MPRAGADRYPEWVPVGVAGEKMSLAFLAVRGLPPIEHLVYLLLLEEGDRRVDTEESKHAGHAILDLQSALVIATCVSLDKVRGDEGSPE